MATFKRTLIALILILSLGFLMGQEGSCFFLGTDEEDLFSNTNVIGF